MSDQYTTDQLIEGYIKLRDMRDEKKAEHDAELKVFDDKMSRVSAILNQRMSDSGVKAFKTDHGTATLVEKSQAQCHDWQALEKFAIENDRLDFFARRLNVTTVKEYMEESQSTPPGVRLETTASVQVRRKTTRAK